MNQPVAGPVGLPGGGGPRTGRPGGPGNNRAAETERSRESGRIAESAWARDGNQVSAVVTDTDRLLRSVEDELTALDRLGTPDQVAVYDRLHTTLADALARTADTGGPPGPGEFGA